MNASTWQRIYMNCFGHLVGFHPNACWTLERSNGGARYLQKAARTSICTKEDISTAKTWGSRSSAPSTWRTRSAWRYVTPSPKHSPWLTYLQRIRREVELWVKIYEFNRGSHIIPFYGFYSPDGFRLWVLLTTPPSVHRVDVIPALWLVHG